MEISESSNNPDGASVFSEGGGQCTARRKTQFKYLNQTTISFFFTHYPEAVSVSELWRFFAICATEEG